MQTAQMELAGGGSQTLNLPELDPAQQRDLSIALEALRGICNLSPRKYRGAHTQIAHELEEFLPLGVQARNLHDRDNRAEIVALPSQLFHRFMDLAFNVANDPGPALQLLETVGKGFGLSSKLA